METRWKFLNLGIGTDGREEAISAHDGTPWVIGEWRDAGSPDEVECCVHGFHCSPDPLAALGYVSGEVVAEVEVDGASHEDGSKSAHQRMRLVRAWKWGKRDSVALAIFAAEQVLGIYERAYPDDPRPRKAIEAAKAYLQGRDPSAYAAYAAADAADAAYAAADAAYAAAAHADADAAYDAAYDADAYAHAYAAYAAYDAADAAAHDAAHDAAAAAAAAAHDAARDEVRQELAAWMVARFEQLPPVGVVG